VEGCFRRAIDLAREYGSTSLELRAAVDLARLLCDRGRRDEARTELSAIYSRFTEGFDTPDLTEARALLRDLGA
jgi:predicted ATPase